MWIKINVPYKAGFPSLPPMTLDRLSERLEEEKAKIGKLDGRRFNVRSKTKMMWEMRNIEKAHAQTRRKKRNGGNRSTYTPEELQEYKEIEDKFRQEQVSFREKEDARSQPPDGLKSTGEPDSDSSEIHGLKSTPLKKQT